MAKLILFSEPNSNLLEKLKTELFTRAGLEVAYMPSDGSHPDNPKYEDFWREYVANNDASLIPIDNSKRGGDVGHEKDLIHGSDALILTGGNTFQFLYHLKESTLDEAIIDFAKQEDKIIAGFSAGAIILSQTIEIAGLPGLDENLIGIDNLSGLGLIDFDIFPHYEAERSKADVDKYSKNTGRAVKRLTNDDLIVLDY
jgi:peptidase E